MIKELFNNNHAILASSIGKVRQRILLIREEVEHRLWKAVTGVMFQVRFKGQVLELEHAREREQNRTIKEMLDEKRNE